MTPTADQPDRLHLETDRLHLRRRRPADAEVMHRLWRQRDPRVPPHRRIGPDGRPTVADLEHGLAAQPPPTTRSLGLLALQRRAEGDVIGYCGVVTSNPRIDLEPELAFEVLEEHRGHGYATEAARAVVHWARGAGHPRLWATVWDWNTPSLRVLGKLGFLETDRTEVDPRRGVTLFSALDL